MANAKKSYRIRSRELVQLEIQSLDFKDLSESRRSQRRRVRSPVLTMQEKREMQMRQQKESRSRRALERELKSVGLFDESMFSTDTGNTIPSLQTLESTNSRESQLDDIDDNEESKNTDPSVTDA